MATVEHLHAGVEGGREGGEQDEKLCPTWLISVSDVVACNHGDGFEFFEKI